jgi:glycosyltransferase involved in cell wall biosynthesis
VEARVSTARVARVTRAAQAAPPARPTVSVVIAAYSDFRWLQLRDAVASVLAQTRPALETIVVVDHNPDLLSRARRELADAVVIPSSGARGASGARNTGVALSRGEIVAFLDDDARATPDWLETLIAGFADPAVAGVGGRVDPLWATARPRWLPREFDWTVGASYSGMPETTAQVRNVWTNNMALRRAAFDAAGGFREDFGKVGAVSRPEDTDLCLRVTSGAWLYEPAGAVGHWVPQQRATFRYFLVRCFNEGRGKAGIAVMDGAAKGTSTERSYTVRVLPSAVGRGLWEAVAGDRSGVLRSAAIVGGFGMAAAGFVIGFVAGCVSAPGSRRAAARLADAKLAVSL